ncbi:MAG TPA: LysM peptidoglycan-binding domain-containing protein [Steroidobacteraceae bacterium]|jgi:LysM repeat protein|nr:LysM peptidoglycan-binding domain-containing protein [Steroidobacteraceae bacterium]
MVSNQVLAQPVTGLDGRRRGALLRSAACGIALTLISGCSLFHSAKKPVARAPATQSRAADAAVNEAPQNAIEAALARGDVTDANSTVSTSPGDSGPALNPNAPKSYTVKRGDTLWDISAMFLRDPWLWPEIWYVNPAVQNPHLIYPGDVLALAYGSDGRPQIRLERGGAARVQPLVRSSPIDGAIATIPFAAISAFLGRPSVISKAELRSAPKVVALRDRHVVGGAGHEIYVRGLGDAAPGRYNVMRLGDPLKDPATGKLLGYMGVYTATARVESTEGKLSKALLTESARETQAGDLLFPDDTQTHTDIIPHAGPADLEGQIVSVVDGVTLIGQYQVVAINRGTKHGLEPGHVLAIDEAGEVVRDRTCVTTVTRWCMTGRNVKLPDERAGTMLVFKTFENMSYALTVSLTVPVRVADRVRAP